MKNHELTLRLTLLIHLKMLDDGWMSIYNSRSVNRLGWSFVNISINDRQKQKKPTPISNYWAYHFRQINTKVIRKIDNAFIFLALQLVLLDQSDKISVYTYAICLLKASWSFSSGQSMQRLCNVHATTKEHSRAVSRLADGNRLAERKNRLASRLSRLKLGMGLPDPNIRYCTKNFYFANITILY